ncbi:MAG: glutamine-hydrolyzing carbamoyl-phosphate synthase small subunit, partial [Eggerthellales bacterium]|nr:glutamine-hydrolyzing carbamoyl-phosphate synthase small subunit [Eggerthellales bacterium]
MTKPFDSTCSDCATPLSQRLREAAGKPASTEAVLMLSDGTALFGRSCGAQGEAFGEICFNTSLEGYLEVLTDPSYAGQIVTMTYPQIGNYGVNPEDVQSSLVFNDSRPALRGLVVHDMCQTPSNWRSVQSLPDYLVEQGVVAIEGIDTRALVRHIRDFGAQTAIISTVDANLDSLKEKVLAAPSIVGINLAKTVSCPEPYSFGPEMLPQSQAFALTQPAPRKFSVVAYDCGIKRSILQGLVRVGCQLQVVPWDTPAEQVLALNPDGVFLSNGPGDPDAVQETYAQVQKLLGKVPVFGICLGHQMISLASGATMEKLKYGHRGGNQPVMNLVTGKVEITAQNHGFGLVFSSMGPI